jgi:hypothetical protein
MQVDASVCLLGAMSLRAMRWIGPLRVAQTTPDADASRHPILRYWDYENMTEMAWGEQDNYEVVRKASHQCSLQTLRTLRCTAGGRCWPCAATPLLATSHRLQTHGMRMCTCSGNLPLLLLCLFALAVAT